nr:hypothetical protein Iba_scaffold864114CG0010 [Ipomoea batatas]GMD30599.1 hypothetical protein Iba_chr09aCG8520 [Ipomoea batatas]GME02143.1 hypothetical protein Iba_contig3959CG0010 [Ipomoea batatas]
MAAVFVAITPAESSTKRQTWLGVVMKTILASSPTASSTFTLSFSCGITKSGFSPLINRVISAQISMGSKLSVSPLDCIEAFESDFIP